LNKNDQKCQKIFSPPLRNWPQLYVLLPRPTWVTYKITTTTTTTTILPLDFVRDYPGELAPER